MQQTDQNLSVVHVPIDDLRPDPANPRRISDAELDSLTRSIRQFGFVDPVIARLEDKSVIGGHQRLLAARRLGLASVPVILLDLSGDQARLLNLALNRISGSWDEELLARLLAELDASPEVDLSLSGFRRRRGRQAPKVARRPRQARAYRALRSRRRPQRRTGQPPRPTRRPVWSLGDHRLLCGDSTDTAAVGRLFGSEKGVPP